MRVSAWLVLGLCLLRTPAFAGNEIDAAQGVIRAHAQAAPEIQALFPSIEIFMAMVREGYAPVYRHRSFEFGPSQAQDGTIMQRVHIVDANGEAWEALYTLQAQTDGSLKITGCSLLKAGQSV